MSSQFQKENKQHRKSTQSYQRDFMHPNHANQQIKPKFVFEARKNILVKVHADYVFENSSFFAQDEIRDRTAKMAVSI